MCRPALGPTSEKGPAGAVSAGVLMADRVRPPDCRDSWRLGVLMFVPLAWVLALSVVLWDVARPAAVPFVFAVLGFYAYRVGRCSVEVADDVVTVRNIFWSHRLPGSDVARISAALSYGGRSVEFVSLHRRSRWPRVVVHASSARSRECRVRRIQWAETLAPVADTRRPKDYLGNPE